MACMHKYIHASVEARRHTLDDIHACMHACMHACILAYLLGARVQTCTYNKKALSEAEARSRQKGATRRLRSPTAEPNLNPKIEH